jgi:hypothetical protein
MLTGIRAHVHHGYTGYDHLIGSSDVLAATDAVAGQSFRRASDAVNAASRAFCKSCDRRVTTAKITVDLRTARGDLITVG